MSDVVPMSQGERMIAPWQNTAKFSDSVGRHHRPFFDDYSVAQNLIAQAIGDINDIDIFGRQVLCGVFCRPNVTPGGIYISTKEVKEDWYQHKVVLVLKCGPEAFTGAKSYHDATFGKDVARPVAGDWLIVNASAGIQISLCGDGAQRPQGKDHRGQPMDIFEWDGWPCRIIGDDNFLGRLTQPHNVV